MLRTTLRTIALAVLISASYGAASEQTALAANPELFANYYVGPPGQPAQLYVSPRPAPPYVGYTWITYEPLAPHEYLYWHKRVYLRHHYGASPTKTTIHWH